MCTANAISSEEHHCLKVIIGREESDHNLMEAGNKYGVSPFESSLWPWPLSVCVAVSDVYIAIVEHLASRYIAIPARERLKLVVDGFMAKCVGAIDSTHIPPKDILSDYYYRKGYHLVVLQALVDHEYKFLDIYVGWPGSIHDVRVLVNSGLYSKCDSESLSS